MKTKEASVLDTLNSTVKKYPLNIGIHEVFSETAKVFPDRIATSSSIGSYTYKELDHFSNVLASQLQQRGIKRGDYVGVCLPRIVELPMVLLAIIKAGAAYVPLDPTFPADRLRMMLDDSQAPIVISIEKIANDLGLTSDKVLIFDIDSIKNQTSDLFQAVPVIENQLAYVLYTSGSTGKPKGVMVKHNGIINLLKYFITLFEVKPEDTLLAISTISFDISVLEFFLPLFSGARVHLATKEQALDAVWLNKTIEEFPITFLQGTPTTWEILLASGWKGSKQLNILCGGEALRAELARKLYGINKSIWNLYGPTEVSIWSTIKRIDENDFNNVINGGLSIGKPVANTLLYIVDEHGNPSPFGEPGELWIGGDGVSIGYLNRPELNVNSFTPNPFAEGIVYRTGDRVTINAEGNLHFLNRIDLQVKIRGFRIELGEVEAALNKTPGIRQGVVVAKTGHTGDDYLAAYFIAEPSEKPIPKIDLQKNLIAAARECMASFLPEYMLPNTFMLLDKFPLTPNAKIDRKILPDPFLGTSTNNNSTSNIEYNKTEKIIADVWKLILNVNEISLDDDFFLLGGHSLLAVRMMVDLERTIGVKLPLAVLFTNPTIRKLSKLYDSPIDELVWNPLVTIKSSGTRNPIYFAHGISGNVFKYYELAQLLDADQPSYGLQAVGLNGIDKPLSTMKEIAAYHVKEIRLFQPNGPYALAGGSFGGFLAYEMALQLRALGQEVNFLCLFDVESLSELSFLPPVRKQIKAAQLFVQRFVKRAFTLIASDKADRKKYLQQKLQSKNSIGGENEKDDLESWLDKHKMVELIGEESAANFRNIEEACYKAMVNYKIGKYDGDIILIRAQEGFFNNTYSNELGWQHFTTGKVDVRVVPGDHNSIFWEPNVLDLSKVVDSILKDIVK